MSSPGRWVRFGFGAVALVDAALNIALFRAPRVSANVQLLSVLYAAGHIVALGLIIGIFADLGRRLLPQKRLAAPLATLVLATPPGIANFADDYSVFELPIRVALYAASIVPFAVLVAIRPWLLGAKWRSIGAGVLALALAVTNPLVLGAEYSGIHLAQTTLAGLFASVGLQGLFGASDSPVTHTRLRRIVHSAALAVSCILGAFTLVIWPSNGVLVMLTRFPTASVLPWLAEARSLTDEESLDNVAPEQRAWFVDRSTLPPIRPSQPPLYQGKPIVIFLTIDALRADIVNDGDRPATKNIRRLAENGALFTFAHSSASATSSAIGSLFAGRYYSSLYWTKRATGSMNIRYFLADDDSLGFPALLNEHDVKTTCVVTANGFKPSFGLARGFSEYTEDTKFAKPTIKRISKWLDGVGDEPAFLWTHLLDAHYPYDRGRKSGSPFDRYLAEVTLVDEQIAVLWETIQNKGLAERTFLILSADHGEGFNEHNKTQHANTLYEELTHIPLIIVGPGIKPARIDEPVSLIDMGPTILDIFGADTPGNFMGESLVPILRGEAPNLTRPIVMDTECGKQAMIGADKLKIIRNVKLGTTELYDLTVDPGEETNLADSRPDEAIRRASALATLLKAHQHRRPGYKPPYR